MPQLLRHLPRKPLAFNCLMAVVLVILLTLPYEGSSWDEPSLELTESNGDAVLFLLLTEIDQEFRLEPAAPTSTSSEALFIGAQSADCVQLWLAYVNAIVQLEVAQANLNKIQTSIEKCLEKRTQAVPQAQPLEPNSLIEFDGFSGSIEVPLSSEENEGSVLD